MQDQAHLVGERAAAAGTIRGELSLVQLDQVLGLAAGAINRLVNMLGRSGLETGDDEADIEPLLCGLDPGAGATVLVPGLVHSFTRSDSLNRHPPVPSDHKSSSHPRECL